MKIQSDDLREGELELSFSYEPEQFPVLSEIAVVGDTEFIGPIAFSLRARKTAGLVEVNGEFRNRLRLKCSRCLKSFDSDRKTAVSLSYSTEPSESMASAVDGELRLTAEEAGMIHYDGDEIDLGEGLQEQVVLSLPYRTLCRDACKGLCPQCGVDLNERECGCRKEVGDPRFDALKHLMPDA